MSSDTSQGTLMKKVKPLPKEYCEHCIFNGCYPWNRNPALRCSELNGLVFAIKITADSGLEECTQYQPITESMWDSHLRDLKECSKDFEDMCKRAITGEVMSSDLPYGQKVQL